MITEIQIARIVNEYFQGTDKFLAEVKVKPSNHVAIFIDGERGITIDDCQELTRYIESKIDRDWEDYDLTVSSFGADKPLILPRQYLKHIGRDLEVTTSEGDTIIGKLIRADETQIDLEYQSKGKEAEILLKTLTFNKIEKAKVVLSFK